MNSLCILLSSYNGEKYIAEQIDSLLAQDFTGIHIFIRDDGSTDGTRNILANYQRQCPNIKCNFADNIGASNSFVELLEWAGGTFDFYAFCDQDDVWLAHKVRRAVNLLSSEKEELPLLYCSPLYIVDQHLQHLGISKMPREFRLGNALVENYSTGCTMMINRRARNLILLYLPQYVCMHDWWINLVVLEFGKVMVDTDPTILYRQHNSNVVGLRTSVVEKIKRNLRYLAFGDKRFDVYRQIEEFCSLLGKERPSSRTVALCRAILSSRSSLLCRTKLVFVKKEVYWRRSIGGYIKCLRYLMFGSLN